jgi:hypothetical protein
VLVVDELELANFTKTRLFSFYNIRQLNVAPLP